MEKLVNFLCEKAKKLSESHPEVDLSQDYLDRLNSVYPFNKFEYVISHLIAFDVISLEDYLELRNEYLERNKYLYLYEITAPRTFGETWAQRHLNELVPELKRPSKKVDQTYSGEYDFWYEGIKIEVKASRAVKRQSGGALVEKALSSDSQDGFDMNFQQIKPKCCDVFVWIGVWRDVIRYWVLSSQELQENISAYSNKQHRNSHDEGQLWIKETNIEEFKQYEVPVRHLLETIITKGRITSQEM